jgi:2-succinyl-5-enolpyruvyl-6-hydroxy-3-cyclohexene-1-carboxylate synthase
MRAMTSNGEQNWSWATGLIGGFAAAGLRHAVISPGSRSSPLALAAMREPRIATDVVVDERSAAFFALGSAKATGSAVAVIATSGSAVANWFPAVVEADMAGVPLLLISADRPPELHGCGANQAMDQVALFGCHVRAFHALPPAEPDPGWLSAFADRVMATCLGTPPGPVHVNVPLREPVLPGGIVGDILPGGPAPVRRLASELRAADESVDAIACMLARERGAIVCGNEDLGQGFHTAVMQLATQQQVPIFADVLSGMRFGSHVVDNVLAYPDQIARVAPPPNWILRFGGTPVSRAVENWLVRSRGTPQFVITRHQPASDPSATATHMMTAHPESLCRALATLPASSDARWLEAFAKLDRAAACAAREACGDGLFEGSLVRALVAALPTRTPLLLGNSLTVRAADWFAGKSAKPLRLFGNRGVSGIDGNLSTAFGIAAALGPTVAVVGDLAFLHDLNALTLGAGRPLTIVVLDNGGGAIFEHLAESTLPEFDRGWLAPQRVDPVAAARAFGLDAVRADSVEAAIGAILARLTEPAAGLVHVPIERALSLARTQGFFAAALPTRS